MKILSENTINEMVQKIVAEYQPDKVILFGSYAAGNPTTDSDLDLLVVKEVENGMPRLSLMGNIRASLTKWIHPMDILVCTPKYFEEEKENKFTFLGQALKKSKLLYDKP